MSINKKILELKKKMPTIYKDAMNTHLKFKYAKLSNILSTMTPVLNEVGLFVDIQFEWLKDSPVIKKNDKQYPEQTRKQGYQSQLYAEQESYTLQQYWLRGSLTVTDAETNETIVRHYDFLLDTIQQNEVQRVGSTYTYAQRYIYGTFFGIAFDEDDPDTTQRTMQAIHYDKEPAPADVNKRYLNKDEYTELFAMASAKMDKEQQMIFLADYEIDSWRAIPKDLYATLKKSIETYRGKDEL